MKKTAAKKAKDIRWADQSKASNERRAARHDVTWRVDDLEDSDIWRQRNADVDRGSVL